MSVAKALKLKEYHTDIISHELSYSNTPNLGTAPRVRFTNTYKSNVLASTPSMDVPEQALTGKITAEQVHLKSRDRLFIEKPLTAKIQRASYQDSNIFGYKEREDITVQGLPRQMRRSQGLETIRLSSQRHSITWMVAIRLWMRLIVTRPQPAKSLSGRARCSRTP